MTWIDEVRDLHAFFERWYRGAEESLDRLTNVLADGFTIVGPSGEELSRSQIVDAVENGRGQRSDLQITTSDHALLRQTDDLVLARYHETHEFHGGSSRRMSTVAFEPSVEAPHGLAWLRVHETWID